MIIDDRQKGLFLVHRSTSLYDTGSHRLRLDSKHPMW